jgi:hypothetical protein
LEIRKDIKEKPTQQLNAFLALCGLKVVVARTVSKGDAKIYEYQLDRTSYDMAEKLIDRRTKSTVPPDDETESRGSYEAPDPLDIN